MKSRLVALTVFIALALVAVAAYTRVSAAPPVVTTDAVSRGSIVNSISATGTLEAVETVEVGTQVSGTVQALGADFNSIVKKGQVLARLDPSLIQSDVERGKANLAAAEADVERLHVMLADANQKLTRARELAARQLIAQSDLDAAIIAQRSAEAQVRSSTAQSTQARASLRQAQVNLGKTVITSPIDGIVISRSVDVGQTVAASLQAPTLFTLAADLSQMQVNASIDESDLGSIHEGQKVSFRVDAYPNDTFTGVVEQVRLNPAIVQNVVTYAAIVKAANPALKLKPGMTAQITVEVARKDNVLRVPSSALRFKPSAAVLAAIGVKPASTTEGAVRPVSTTGTSTAERSNATGTLWIYQDGRLAPVQVNVGLSDSQFTEIHTADVHEGAIIATQAVLPGATTSTSSRPATSNPLLGSQGPRRM